MSLEEMIGQSKLHVTVMVSKHLFALHSTWGTRLSWRKSGINEQYFGERSIDPFVLGKKENTAFWTASKTADCLKIFAVWVEHFISPVYWAWRLSEKGVKVLETFSFLLWRKDWTKVVPSSFSAQFFQRRSPYG